MSTLPGLTEGRRTDFESESCHSRVCPECGVESPRVWRCVGCGIDLVER